MEITLGYVIKTLVLPPGLNIFLALFGLLFRGRWPRAARLSLVLAFVLLWLAATPIVAAWLARGLETAAPITVASIRDVKAQAIVILGGGRYTQAPEYEDADTVKSTTLTRVRFGAHLHRQTGLPIAVVGGSVLAEGESEGALMRGILEDEFAVPVEWVEDRSRNTAQNALQARKVLPVDRIVLVTHALHMRRAARQFEQAGFEVLPAPIQFVQRGHLDYVLFDWLPSIDAFAATYAALHEYLGLVWYRLRY